MAEGLIEVVSMVGFGSDEGFGRGSYMGFEKVFGKGFYMGFGKGSYRGFEMRYGRGIRYRGSLNEFYEGF